MRRGNNEQCTLCAHKHRGVPLPATTPDPSLRLHCAPASSYTPLLRCCHPPCPSLHRRCRHNTLPMLHTPCTCRGTRWCKREGAGGPARGGIVWQEGANPSARKPGAQKGGGDGTTLGVGVLLSSLHVAQKGWGVGEVGGATRRARGWGWRSSGWGRSDRCPSAAGLARGWEGR